MTRQERLLQQQIFVSSEGTLGNTVPGAKGCWDVDCGEVFEELV
jgi:hypothetical protein